MERETVKEVQSNNCEDQEMYRTTLRTELSVIDSPCFGDFLSGLSSIPEFVKDVFHDWVLNYCIRPSLQDEALKELYRTEYPFQSAPALTSVTKLLSFSMAGIFVVCRNWLGCKLLVPSWKQLELSVETCRSCGGEPVENWAMVMDLGSYIHECKRRGGEGNRSCMGLPTTSLLWRLKKPI